MAADQEPMDRSKEQTGLNGEHDVAATKQADPKLKTRIGRLVSQAGTDKKVYVDEADDACDFEDPDDLRQRFVITINSESDDEVMIYSPYVRRLFESVAPSYPDVSYARGYLAIPKPYESLYHYFDAIKGQVQQVAPQDGESADDFFAFERWFNQRLKDGFDRIRGDIDRGTIRFRDLWALFRPGSLAFSVDILEQLQLQVLIGPRFLKGKGKERDAWEIESWWVAWDRFGHVFTRFTRAMKVEIFAGARTITSLPVYPLESHAGEMVVKGKKWKTLDYLQSRGDAYYRLVSVPSKCMDYKGRIESVGYQRNFNGGEKSLIRGYLEGRVVADREGAQEELAAREYEDRVREMRGCGTELDHMDWDDYPLDAPLSPLQAQLCPPKITAFSLETGKWYFVHVDNLSEIEWNQAAFEGLVLEEASKKTLRDLVEQHKRSKGNVLSDFIHNKGMGLVVVLHGPPGVGKTLTAESVAEYTQKPLYQVSVGDLTQTDGFSPFEVERGPRAKIEGAFERASHWDAVLLIDEADVILEARSFEDFRRNTLVSIFLRALEYYRGILFITTNRIRTIDTAFQSRIHIALRFRSLTAPVRRQIWERFISRLDSSEARAKKELFERLDDLQEWELNGRQIRNVIMIAQSLSFSNARRKGALKYKDVEDVANQTISFQDFFEEDSAEKTAQLMEVPGKKFREFARRQRGLSIQRSMPKVFRH